jgi:hypothetical protein
VDRELTERERAVLTLLASPDTPGGKEVRDSLQHLRVSYECSCGCESFMVRDLRRALAAPNKEVWSAVRTDDEVTRILLWVDEHLCPSMVDVFTPEEGRLPDPETLSLYSLQPSEQYWATMPHPTRRLLAGAADYPGRADRSYDGFRVTVIVEPSGESCRTGRAIVTAPDRTVAWVVWEADVPRYLRQLRAPDDQRWGAWMVGSPQTPTTPADCVTFFADVTSALRPHWEAWSRGQEQTG